ncbi:MAG: dephospho-CoA kinase [Salinisphaera sp.]|nr:dephospho-CoA kinase [Salinisphaera sp.]
MTSGQAPLRIGLTGGIGSGKTTVAGLFAALGVPVFDADELTRELTAAGQPALTDIRRVFGDEVFDGAGHLSRPTLREWIFRDAEARRKLEAILHPLVYQELERRTVAAGNADYIIWMVPLLLETAASDTVDRVLVVDCPEAAQIARASRRDDQSTTAIRRIMAQQLPREERLRQADDVLVNDSDRQHLQQQARQLDAQYRALARERQPTRTTREP